jgi:hypothetical protein
MYSIGRKIGKRIGSHLGMSLGVNSGRGGGASNLLLPPTNISAIVTATGVTINFTPRAGMETEIWVSIDGAEAILIATTGLTVGTYDYVTDEPHDFIFTLRSKQDLTVLNAPTTLAGVDAGDGVDLTWVDTNGGVHTYQVWGDINDAGYALITTTAAGAEAYHHSTTGTSIKYKVRATEGTLPVVSSYSNEITVAVAASPAQPTNFAVVWGAADTATMTFDDESGGTAQHELYESLAGGAYTLVTTLGTGVETYANATWMNASMSFKMRAKLGSKYSAYTDVVSLITPLVFRTNQSTPTNVQVALGVPLGKTVNINWGDGSNDDFSNYSYAIFTHNYGGVINPAYIQISGDINSITRFSIPSQAKVIGSLSKWVFHTGITAAFELSGSGTTGDFTGKVLPANSTSINFSYSSFIGDLSGVSIPVGLNGNHILRNTPFTAPPRGDYRNTLAINCISCNMNTAALQAWFDYLAAFFAVNTPTRNCAFNVSGVSNGIVADDYASITAIRGYYTAAGKTATITTRTS